MSLTAKDVVDVARLARLDIDATASEALVGELSRIVDFVDQLQSVATDDIEPMAHPLQMQQRLRADEVTEKDSRAHYQENAPAVEDGMYLVPRVID
ncbi:MAG: Asp-tRNA(Asn)/Glu-tRNA(Gln) amidotransferase subunit GatC [Gammaproteobacteria bacterium]|nr:Asp-tRNA(Asn)/Glu-tRNA(Gln) amidotransferase subunit GatC [Gammaproteobacteria bacterium]NND58769.1 Asp-tRNA(Asn)/Glu-tRNA(Gln) amidotransferase subunit GatC [Gammaproteobacteria bacterium]